MKRIYLIPVASLLLIFTSSCDRKSPDADRLVELEQKNLEAQERQRELEDQLEDARWAAEQDAIDRERLLIAQKREELENFQNDAAAARKQALRTREQELARREGQLEQNQAAQANRQADLDDRNYQLSARDRQLAGREAIAFRAVEQRVPVADYGLFYDSLSSHGSWFETPDYGFVWQPVAVRESNWRPYSHGRWACSDRGWTWISEEPFGWATYHYGRWALLRGRGWIWVPGSEWAPSWVSWRESGSHIGWAPLPPETMAYRGRHQWNSTVDERFGIAPSWYNFVEIRHFGGPVYTHRISVTTNVTIIQKTVNITHIHIQNNQVISGGPRYQKINERVGRPLPFYRLVVDHRARGERDYDRIRPQIQGDRLMVSAPNVSADWNQGLRPNQVKGRMETVEVERKGSLDREIATRYRESRMKDRQKAEKSIEKFGGREKFERGRTGQLVENRRQVAAELPAPQERPVRLDPQPRPAPEAAPADPAARPPVPEVPRPSRPTREATLPATPPVVQADQIDDVPPPPARRDRTRPVQDPAPAAPEKPITRQPEETPPPPVEVPKENPEKEESARETDRSRVGGRQRGETPVAPQKEAVPAPMPPTEIPVEEQPRDTNASAGNKRQDRQQEQARQTEQAKLELQAKEEADRLAQEAALKAQAVQEAQAETQARKEDEARAAIAARLQKEESEKLAKDAALKQQQENERLAKEAARIQQQEERRLQQEEMRRQKEEAAVKQQEMQRKQMEEAKRLQEEAQRQREETKIQEEEAKQAQEEAQGQEEAAREQEEAAREQPEENRGAGRRQREKNPGQPERRRNR